MLRAETGLTPDHIGFATPGVVNPATGTMKNSNTTCLNGMPVVNDIARTLGVPVTLANDANCFALAEATLGAVPAVVPDFRLVFGVILGTGVGGGVVIRGLDGQPLVIGGHHGIGGESLTSHGDNCYSVYSTIQLTRQGFLIKPVK